MIDTQPLLSIATPEMRYFPFDYVRESCTLPFSTQGAGEVTHYSCGCVCLKRLH